MSTAFAELKARQAVIWGSAPWERLATDAAGIHDDLIARLGVTLGERWLDLATGTGAIALRAARQGAELERGPGEAHLVGTGHDAWAVGDEPCVTIDFIPAGDTAGGRVGRRPCRVEFRVAADDRRDHLVAAIRQHAKGSHDHELTREHLLAELGVPAA